MRRAATYRVCRPRGATAIDVIDGPRLCDLLKEQGLGVRTEMVEEVSIDPGWFKTV